MQFTNNFNASAIIPIISMEVPMTPLSMLVTITLNTPLSICRTKICFLSKCSNILTTKKSSNQRAIPMATAFLLRSYISLCDFFSASLSGDNFSPLSRCSIIAFFSASFSFMEILPGERSSSFFDFSLFRTLSIIL